MDAPVGTSFSSARRATSRRTGSKHDTTTVSGVSSMMTSTPVASSNARMLRPSRPMMRPFISSFGSATATPRSPRCAPPTRSAARRARRSSSPRARRSTFLAESRISRSPMRLDASASSASRSSSRSRRRADRELSSVIPYRERTEMPDYPQPLCRAQRGESPRITPDRPGGNPHRVLPAAAVAEYRTPVGEGRRSTRPTRSALAGAHP
jgi:hypothetical protein